MSGRTETVEALLTSAAAALADSKPSQAIAHFAEANALFLADPDAVGVETGARLAFAYRGLAIEHPNMADGQQLIAVLRTFCALGTRAKADPAWIIQYYINLSKEAVAHGTREQAIEAQHEGLAYFKANPGLAYSDYIGDFFFLEAKILFEEGRYAEAEAKIGEAIAFAQAHAEPAPE